MKKINNLAICVNTVSECSDLWEMFFTQFEKHFPDQKLYVFSDIAEGIPKKYTTLIYSKSDSYRTQYLNCIKQVSEEYCISLNEDYILYSDVMVDELIYCMKYLDDNKEYSFIRLTRGIEYDEPMIADKLYLMNNKNMYFFSQVAGIWRKSDLELIHQKAPESGMAYKVVGPQLEIVANDVCRELDLKGLFFYNGEKKRGKHHYDSSVFPYIATAIIKGKWNIKEYIGELMPLIIKYNIDVHKRGVN